MVFLAGPQQAGKTTLAKEQLRRSGQDPQHRYLTWDKAAHRELILQETFPAGPGMLVLDEIHKYRHWRQAVKGLFDTRGDELRILVTGSARLDHYRRGGDSLQGRYHFLRLLPLSLAELEDRSQGSLEALLHYSGFPEPFLEGSELQTRRWSREYRSRLVREDLRDLERVHDIDSIEKMVLRLPALVGSPLSLNALREDLMVSHQSVSRWMSMLENLYLVFRLYPFGAPMIRAVKKEAKHYHLNWTVVRDPGPRFENLVACHLLKWAFFLQDTEGRDVELRYFRDVDRREVDFVLVEDGRPTHFLECKLAGRKLSTALRYLKKRFPEVPATQLVLRDADIDVQTRDGIRLQAARLFLAELV